MGKFLGTQEDHYGSLLDVDCLGKLGRHSHCERADSGIKRVIKMVDTG